MSRQVTYGDLIVTASKFLDDAEAALVRDRLPDRAAALVASASYRDLLDALHRHGLVLLGSDVRAAGLRASDHPQPVEAAGLTLIAELGALARRRPAVESGPETAASAAERAWGAAALRVRAATDLLASHRDAVGGYRSPDAALADAGAARDEGLRELAAMTAVVARAADPLLLRAGQAGLPRRDLDRVAPNTDRLREAATAVGRTGAGPAMSVPVLHALALARPTVRTDAPVDELTDRLARLRHEAWTHLRAEHLGVATLGDYAALGVVLHTHAAALLESETSATGPLIEGATRGLRETGMSWRLLHRELSSMRTATPARAGVRGDVQAVRLLLSRLVPLTGQESSIGPVERKRLLATVLGGTRAMVEVAGWHRQVFTRLGVNKALYLPGRQLSSQDVIDSVTLAVARLRNDLVPVPTQHLEVVAGIYDRAAHAAARLGRPGDAPRTTSRELDQTPVPSR